MSDIEKQKRGKIAFILNERISKNELERRRLFLENVEILSQIYDNAFFKEILGDEDGEWYSYLSQLEIYYTRSHVIRWQRIKNKLIDDWGFKIEDLFGIPSTRLEKVASLSNNFIEAKGLLDEAGTALGQDWKDIVRKRQGKKTRDDTHEHKFKKIKICDVCGMKTKDNES